MKNVNDDRGIEVKGHNLRGLSFDFIVAGGIAAVESPRIVRELRRYGASVRVVMTAAAQKFVTPLSLEWASTCEVITHLSGTAEHITDADAAIVAPATLDLISKLALGVADDSALTLLQSILGRRPIFVVPTMHESLWENPLFQRNLEVLKKIQHFYVLGSDVVEGKKKMLGVEVLAENICHRMSQSKLKDKTIAINLGATRSYLDDIRFLSNISSGAMGLEISRELFLRGAHVTIIAGACSVFIPDYFKILKADTVQEMTRAFQRVGHVDVSIMSAAVLDFEVKHALAGKRSTSSKNDEWNLRLLPTNKIIDQQRKRSKVLVGFKLESRLSREELAAKVREWNRIKKCDVVVGNILQGIDGSNHETLVFNSNDGELRSAKTKRETALLIADQLETLF